MKHFYLKVVEDMSEHTSGRVALMKYTTASPAKTNGTSPNYCILLLLFYSIVSPKQLKERVKPVSDLKQTTNDHLNLEFVALNNREK